MMDAYIRAKIDIETKRKATKALKDIGISVSDYIRMAIIQVVDKKAIPFDINVPNKITTQTIEKSMVSKDVHTAKDAQDLFDKLGI
jgi:DNA-damage-inducible protein J